MRRLFERFPRLWQMARRLKRLLVGSGSVSSHYKMIADVDVDRESSRLRDAWQNEAMPERQRELVDRQLARFRGGDRIDVFDIAVEAIAMSTQAGGVSTVLEIGCSSGFYSEVFEIAGLPIIYAGCDYAPRFIEMARAHYPDSEFQIGDATSLQYRDGSFDIVISGCCLLHIPEYGRAIEESARVASGYVLFHRTPVVPGSNNKVFTKKAYGVETVETHFGEAALLKRFEKSGLQIVKTWTLSEDSSREAQRTYLCAKKRTP